MVRVVLFSGGRGSSVLSKQLHRQRPGSGRGGDALRSAWPYRETRGSAARADRELRGGRHDAARILGPFIESLGGRRRAHKLAVLLHDAGSADEVTQTLLEMVRGGLADQAVETTVFYQGESLDRGFLDSLPFVVRALGSQ